MYVAEFRVGNRDTICFHAPSHSPFREVFAASLVQELRARDNAFDQVIKSVAIRRQLAAHFLNECFVRKYEAAAQCASKEFPAHIIDEIVLAALADVLPQALQTRPLAAAGKCGGGINRPTRKVLFTAFANRPKSLK